MRRAAQNAMLGAYRLVFARGLLSVGWGRRLFFALYDIYKRMFEAGPIDALRAYVPAGGIVIDVGANVGFFTERFARWVGPHGRVIALEPERANFAELSRRLSGKGLAARVDAQRAVADSASGTAHLVINPDHPGDHHLGDAGERVTATTLDAIAPAGGRTSLIKIDVQGAEIRVLAGARNVLARDKPALFVEIDPGGLAHYGGSVDALLGALAAAGYSPHILRRAGARACSRGELDALLARRGYTDLLFLADRN
ncbi:MAG TPA: FkbM family methyltransferase [Alphaproteobacteria bacterium]|jgi:FkbM family methyltransferase